jgi:hypothetical protein
MEPANDPMERGLGSFGLEEQDVFSGELETSSGDAAHKFKITVVYQDRMTRNWAMQLCDPVEEKFGGEYVQNTWYDVNSLSDPKMLLEAAGAALSADVIVISVYAADELPPEFYAWIDVWLPRRLSRAGALAAFIGVAGEPATEAIRTQEYLQAVARRGRLDFLPHERRLPDGSRVSFTRPIAEPARVGA